LRPLYQKNKVMTIISTVRFLELGIPLISALLFQTKTCQKYRLMELLQGCILLLASDCYHLFIFIFLRAVGGVDFDVINGEVSGED